MKNRCEHIMTIKGLFLNEKGILNAKCVEKIGKFIGEVDSYYVRFRGVFSPITHYWKGDVCKICRYPELPYEPRDYYHVHHEVVHKNNYILELNINSRKDSESFTWLNVAKWDGHHLRYIFSDQIYWSHIPLEGWKMKEHFRLLYHSNLLVSGLTSGAIDGLMSGYYI